MKFLIHRLWVIPSKNEVNVGAHGSDIWIVISKDVRIPINQSGFHGSCQPKGCVSVAHFSETPRVWERMYGVDSFWISSCCTSGGFDSTTLLKVGPFKVCPYDRYNWSDFTPTNGLIHG